MFPKSSKPKHFQMLVSKETWVTFVSSKLPSSNREYTDMIFSWLHYALKLKLKAQFFRKINTLVCKTIQDDFKEANIFCP